MRGPPTGWVCQGRAGAVWDPGTRGDSWCLQTSASSQEEGVTVLASRGSCHSATQRIFTENLLLPGTVCSQQRAKPSPGSRGAPAEHGPSGEGYGKRGPAGHRVPLCAGHLARELRRQGQGRWAGGRAVWWT